MQRLMTFTLILLSLFIVPQFIVPQNLNAQDSKDQNRDLELPESVAVKPKARDRAIETRISAILAATGWFENPSVQVNEGVATLSGVAQDEKSIEWAGKLAQSTEDVVAVVNKLEIATPVFWDLSPLKNELMRLVDQIKRKIPLILIAVLLIGVTWLIAFSARTLAHSLLRKRIASPLLTDVLVKISVIPVFIFGLYLFLRVAGLTSLAITVLGGTGLFGLILGFAFKDIAENLLASILISAHNPFAKGDLIQIGDHEGYVQSVNMRATLLMTLDGNHVQIPNATVYKGIIVNRTANPNMRLSFNVGISFQDEIAKAQAVALNVIDQHEATLKDPEPLVLVDALGAATVNLQMYFWVDITKYSQFKVRSALIRLTKAAFDQNGITMPDEAREILFPKGVPIQIIKGDAVKKQETARVMQKEPETVKSEAEGDLATDAAVLQDQARKSRTLESGTNLLSEQRP